MTARLPKLAALPSFKNETGPEHAECETCGDRYQVKQAGATAADERARLAGYCGADCAEDDGAR